MSEATAQRPVPAVDGARTAGDVTGGPLDRLERRLESVLRYVPYVSLAVATALAAVSTRFWPQPALSGTIAIAAVAAAWTFWWVTLHPRWRQRRGPMRVYFLGLLTLIAVLVVRNPMYGFYAFTGYLHTVYALRGRARLAGIAVTAVLSALSQAGGVPTLRTAIGLLLFAVVALFNICLATAMSVLGWVGEEQAVRRKQMIAELAEANARLETALAENAGLHAQLVAQAREAGVLDERQRMAGEIHDTLAQGLTGIITQLEAAEQAAAPQVAKQAPRPAAAVGADLAVEADAAVGADVAIGADAAAWRRHVGLAARLARDSLAEARRSVHALRPSPLDGARLPEALADVVARWSERTGTPVELATTGTARSLLPEIEVALLRTAQEALANVAKHAGASRVGLTLSYMEDLVTLDVRDDGTGFDPAAVPSGTAEGGFGLPAMRERLLRVAGSLAVESEPGGGTALCACVPALATPGPRT